MWCTTQIRIGRFSDFSFFHQLSMFCLIPPLNFFHLFVKSVVFATSHSQCFLFLLCSTSLSFFSLSSCVFSFSLYDPQSSLLLPFYTLHLFSTDSPPPLSLVSTPVLLTLYLLACLSFLLSRISSPHPFFLTLSSPQLQHGVLFPWQQYANELVDLLASLNYSSLLLSLLSCFAVDKYACHGLLLTQKHLLT